MKKRLLSILLAAVMVFSLLPVAFADNTNSVSFQISSANGCTGTVSYKFNPEGSFTDVSGNASVTVPQGAGSITVKAIPTGDAKINQTNSGIWIDDTRLANVVFSDLQSDSGYTYTLTDKAPQIRIEFDNNDGTGGSGGQGSRTYSVNFGTASWTVNEMTVTASVAGKTLTGGAVSLTDNDEIVLANFNSETMDVALSAEDGFTTTLVVTEGKTHMNSLPSGGLPNGTLTFFVRGKQNNPDPGPGPEPQPNPRNELYKGNQKSVNITIASGDADFCINNSNMINGHANDPTCSSFNDVRFSMKESSETVDFYISSFINERYTSFVINNTEYVSQLPKPEDNDFTEKMLEACTGQINEFKIENVPFAEAYTISATKKVLDDTDTDYCVVGNFLWRYDANPEGQSGGGSEGEPDDALFGGNLEFVSVTYNETTYNSLEALENAPACYSWDNAREEHPVGSALFPAGASLTVRLVPDYGNQLVDFGPNGQKNFTTSGETPCVYTFTVAKGNFHLGARFAPVSDSVVSTTQTVREGTVNVADNTVTNGTIRMTVGDGTPIETLPEGVTGETIATLDITLDNVYYAGSNTVNENWTKNLTELNDAATVSLAVSDLDSNENYSIIREHKNGGGSVTYDEIPVTYNSETGTITFATDKFSTYALVKKSASGAHTHGTGTEAITFEPWDGGTEHNSMPSDAKNYVLTSDITLTSTWTVPSGVTNLCLNGHVIKQTATASVITVSSGATLNLYDCDTNTEHAGYVDANGLWHLGEKTPLAEGETAKSITGGVITGGDANNNAGGGVAVNAGGKFNMYGGSITGNSATNGGGVSNAGTFTMTGGTITGNTATKGGGVYTTFLATNALTGGIITKNSATVGGGLYAKEEECFAAGTPITMADGSRKPIETLKIGDVVRVFDHDTGTISTAKLFDLWKYPEKHSGAVTLHFSHSIDVTVVYGHSFFDREANKYVSVSRDNVKSYVGHEFYNVDDARWETLIGYDFLDGEVDTYVITSEKYLNSVANGMLNNEDGLYTLITNVFEFGDCLKIDAEKKASDIKKYGLWSFDNTRCISKNTYDMLNFQYLSVAFGKGMITPEEFAYLESFWTEVDPELLGKTEKEKEESKPTLRKMLLGASPLETPVPAPTKAGIYVGGSLKITGNDSGNLYLSSGTAITIGTGTGTDGNGVVAPTETLEVGVTMQTPGQFTTNGTSTDTKYFTSDKADYEVKYNTNGYLELKAITIADILPADFPTTAENGWVNENGAKMYSNTNLVQLTFSIDTLSLVVSHTAEVAPSGNNYVYNCTGSMSYTMTFVMENDVLVKVIVSDATWPSGVNGTYAPETYTVTFDMNGHGEQISAQTITKGGKVTKPADPTANGWTFGGWYADEALSTEFNFDSVINADTTIYAKWTKNTPAPSGDSTPIVTVPVTGDENSVKVSATVSGSTATIKDIKDADLAKVTGGESVEIDLTGLKRDIDTAKIPTATVEKIGEQAGMSVKLTIATVSFDKTATQEISDQAKGNTVELVVDDIKEVSLNAVQKETVQKLDTALIIDAYLVSGGTKLCTENSGGFNGGKATVMLPYEIKNNRSASNYNVYYVDDAGKLQKLNAKYDEELAAFVFEIEHFSVYAVAYDENACPQDETCVYAKFTDADTKAWYHDGVHFCVENGYMQGVSTDKFAPSGTLSRGMIVTMLWRMEGEPVVNYAMSFKDVKADQWYTEAIRWAQSTKVVTGYDENTFGPNDPITREQMATILYNYAKLKGQGFTGSWMFLLDFVDRSDISSWADEAVHWCSMKGIVNGKTENGSKVFDPKGKATRAEAASMVQRFCEAVSTEE